MLKRQMPKDMAEADAITALETVRDAFGESWLLTKPAVHRLQKLWLRQDHLSGLELISLGDSIAVMNAKFASWVRDKISNIKKGDQSSHGQFFEILACAALVRGGMPLRPTRDNEPGVDAVITFGDGFEMRLSMKNHDVSEQEKLFRNHARQTRELARKTFAGHFPAYRMTVNANEALGVPDWERVRALLNRWFVRSNVFRTETVAKKAFVTLAPMGPHDSQSAFSPSHLSDTFIAISAHHKNEQKGFQDKVDKAISNLLKHGKRSAASANVVFMRLHPTADMNEIEKHASTILNADGDPGVDAIFLYQAAVVRHNESSLINHYVRYVGSPRWSPVGRKIVFSSIFGCSSTAPPRHELWADGQTRMSLEQRYVFQAGDHFCLASESGGVVTGNVSAIAAGIHVHAVLTAVAPGMVISGRLPQDEELTIL